MSEKPIVLVHYHIYKNAGSSVDAAMRSYFDPENVIELDRDRRYRDSTAFNIELVREVLVTEPNIRGLACHKFVPTIHLYEDLTALPIVFLRHPLLRLASVYRFERISPEHKHTPSGKLAQKMGFATWLEAYTDQLNFKNYQTRLLSIKEDGKESSFASVHHGRIGDLKVAMERLDAINDLVGVGIVERFDQSTALMEKNICRFLPGFTLAGFSVNTTNAVSDADKALAKLEASIPTSTLKKVIENNASDYALYERYRSHIK